MLQDIKLCNNLQGYQDIHKGQDKAGYKSEINSVSGGNDEEKPGCPCCSCIGEFITQPGKYVEVKTQGK